MSNPIKASKYRAAFHLARCQSRWFEIPELARKVRKHDPNSTLLAATATAEALLENALLASGKFQFAEASPDAISIEQIADIREKLQTATEASSQESSLEKTFSDREKQQLEIVAAKLELVIGNAQEAKRRTRFLESESIPSALDDYTTIILLKGLAINAMAHEQLGHPEIALSVYKKATHHIDVHNPDLVQESRNVIETILYRNAILARTAYTDFNLALSSFELYTTFIASSPQDWRLANRTELYRQYFMFFSKAFANSPDSVRIGRELNTVTPIYEDLLHKTTVFPRAGHTNPILLEFVNLILANHVSRGSPRDDCPRILQSLYRASEKTFLSPLIMRHLMAIYTQMGDYVMARNSFQQYLEIIRQAKQHHLVENVTHQHQDNQTDIDSDVVFVETICSGVRLCARFLQDGMEAVKYADMAKEIADIASISDTHVLALVSRAQGVAYGLWAQKTFEARDRPGLQLTAIKHLITSDSLVPDCHLTHYLLALQYAENRDVPSALHHIRIALQLSQKYIPSWHLLALLLSAQENFEDALEACEAAFAIAKVDQDNNAEQLGLDMETRVAILRIKIARIAIIEMSDGILQAVKVQGDLFELYTWLFGTKVFLPKPRFSDGVTTPLHLVQPSRKTSVRSFFTRKLDSEKGSVFSGTTGVRKVDGKLRPQTSSSTSGNVSTFTPKDVASIQLLEIWLVVASLFRKAELWDQCVQALDEAEAINEADPDLFVQRGLYHFARNEVQLAAKYFEDSVYANEMHILGNTALAMTLLQNGEKTARDRAEGILEQVTKSEGWDYPEAWYLLGTIYMDTGRGKKAERMFKYCLELEDTRACRRWDEVGPRFP